MKRFGRYSTPYLFMRIGLGLTYVWIGIDMFRNRDAWIGYLPQNLPAGLSPETALHLAGAFDLALGILFLVNYAPKVTAALSTIHLLFILVTQRLDAVLIRDVGLLGTSLALFFWPPYRRKSWRKIPFFNKKRRPPADE